tara:strand:+ start:2493 stop:2963 length:471 start_codon:yes stop_codon:yes gene_type:complete
MITTTAKLTGDKSLERILKELGQSAIKDSQIKQGLRKIAKPIIRDMRSNAKGNGKSTGALAKSIGFITGLRSRKGRPFVLVGPRYSKLETPEEEDKEATISTPADLVEFGSTMYDVKFEGKRFVQNTYEAHKTRALNELKNEILKLLQKKLNKLKR